jgi:hypothetical protein
MLKTRNVFVLLALAVVGIAAYQAYGGYQRDPRDVTFQVEVKAIGRVTHVDWEAIPAGQGKPSFAGHDWHHDVTLPHPGKWLLHLQAVVQPLKTLDGKGNTMFRGATVICRIVSHNGTASNVSTSQPGHGCNVDTTVIVPPDQ